MGKAKNGNKNKNKVFLNITIQKFKNKNKVLVQAYSCVRQVKERSRWSRQREGGSTALGPLL